MVKIYILQHKVQFRNEILHDGAGVGVVVAEHERILLLHRVEGGDAGLIGAADVIRRRLLVVDAGGVGVRDELVGNIGPWLHLLPRGLGFLEHFFGIHKSIYCCLLLFPVHIH